MAKKKMWGGRFAQGENPLFAEFNRSFGFDKELLRVDIRGSIAYARALRRAGILSEKDARRVEGALQDILEEHWKNPDLPVRSQSEDVHSYVEEALTKRIGSLALRLHTGRSRNDQVATDLRLYLRDQCSILEGELRALLTSIAAVAEGKGFVICPGYTHLQLAQPVLFGHFLLAYGEMFMRDRQRLREALTRINVSPLGSGALAGTVYGIDRERLAQDLGFNATSENSMDAVADRDFVLDFLYVASVLAMHMSRMSEDLVLYSSSEFAFVVMHDSVSSGSSLMPQKKNPDALELIRGKTGRVYGHLLGLLTVLKGLPLTYNKDLQEDKEGLFDTVRTVCSSVVLLRCVLDTMEIVPQRMLEAASNGYLNATELADYLVTKGMAFREAHHLVGRVVRRAVELNKRLEELDLGEYRSFSKLFKKDLYDWLDLEQAISRRVEKGGTSKKAVTEALQRFRERIAG